LLIFVSNYIFMSDIYRGEKEAGVVTELANLDISKINFGPDVLDATKIVDGVNQVYNATASVPIIYNNKEYLFNIRRRKHIQNDETNTVCYFISIKDGSNLILNAEYEITSDGQCISNVHKRKVTDATRHMGEVMTEKGPAFLQHVADTEKISFTDRVQNISLLEPKKWHDKFAVPLIKLGYQPVEDVREMYPSELTKIYSPKK
jgi:hypothetical protein